MQKFLLNFAVIALALSTAFLTSCTDDEDPMGGHPVVVKSFDVVKARPYECESCHIDSLMGVQYSLTRQLEHAHLPTRGERRVARR